MYLRVMNMPLVLNDQSSEYNWSSEYASGSAQPGF